MGRPISDMKDSLKTVCPVTGLPVISRPEWNVIIPDKGYKALISIIGNQIINARIIGYSTRGESRKTAQILDSIIPEYLDRDRGVVQIFDLRESTGFSLASRKNYLRAIKRREGLLGHIYFNTSMMFNISIRIGRKLNNLGFGVHIVNNYKQAVDLALKLTRTEIPASSQFQVDTIHKPFTAFETSDYCPVTGLPVSSHPEWTYTGRTGEFTATFKVIGKHILTSTPRGKMDEHDLELFFALRSRVIREVFGETNAFFEIKDFKTSRTPSRTIRKLFIDHINRDENRMVGFIGYNSPVGVRFAISVGNRLIRPKRPIIIVPTYEKAISLAVAAMASYIETGLFPPSQFFNLSHFSERKTYSAFQVDHFVEEFLHFLGNINWEIDGLDSTMANIPPAHPFSVVFEAIALIKSDLDSVTHERRQALKELRKSEARYRLMAENALKSSEALKQAQEQLIQAEKMAALGGLVAGVSHEISTPLGISVTASSFLQQRTMALVQKKNETGITDKDLNSYLNQAMESSVMIAKNLNRASDLISSFKKISVDQSSEIKRKFNLKHYIDDILQSLYPKFKRSAHTIRFHCPKDIIAESYPGAISQILTNLVMNSLIHGFDGISSGEIQLSVKEQPESLILEYMDNGRGMDQETLKKIFDPFFTTRRASGGTGLGMHIVFNLVTMKLKGSIQCSSASGHGSMFLIQLPH